MKHGGGFGLGHVFVATIRPAKAVGGDPPNGMAVEAPVMGKIALLEGFGSAAGANTAFVEPVAVGVQAILNVIMVYIEAEVAS